MQLRWFKGVAHDTPIDDIKRQFYRLALEHHPDRGGRLEDMQAINAEWDWLKAHHYNIHTSATGSVYTDERQDRPDEQTEHYVDIIDRLIRMGLDIEVCGSWLWISGDTKPHVDELKAMGARWASRKHLWFIGDGKKRKHHLSMEKIRELYGSRTYDGKPTDEDMQLAITA